MIYKAYCCVEHLSFIIYHSFDGTNMRRILRGLKMKLTEVQKRGREMQKHGLEFSRAMIFSFFQPFLIKKLPSHGLKSTVFRNTFKNSKNGSYRISRKQPSSH